MRVHAIILILLLMMSVSYCFADTNDVERPKFFSIITNLPWDWRDWAVSTFTVDNIPSLLTLTGITGAMVTTDYETWQAVKRPYDNNQFFHTFCDQGQNFSKGPFQIGSVAGLLAVGIFGNHRALRTAYQIGEGILASGLIVQALKRATGRQSPFKATTRTGLWRVPAPFGDYNHNTQEYDAMPSGHMQSISTSFFIIMDNYPEQKWLPWLMYPGLVWVSVGLVGTGIHWLSDIPIALALSYSFSKVITARNHPKEQKTTTLWPRFFPSTSFDGDPMVSARWVF